MVEPSRGELWHCLQDQLCFLPPCGRWPHACLERDTWEPVTAVNGAGPGVNGLSGNSGSPTRSLIHVRFTHPEPLFSLSTKWVQTDRAGAWQVA